MKSARQGPKNKCKKIQLSLNCSSFVVIFHLKPANLKQPCLNVTRSEYEERLSPGLRQYRDVYHQARIPGTPLHPSAISRTNWDNDRLTSLSFPSQFHDTCYSKQ